MSSAPRSLEAQARELASPWSASAARRVAESSPDRADREAPAAEDEPIPPPPGAYEARSSDGDVRLAEPGFSAPNQSRIPEPASSLRIPSSIGTRLRSLDADLQVLAVRGGGSVVDGILAIAMGATSVGVAIFMDVSGSGGGSPIAPYLYVYGGSGIVRGILDFIFMPNPSAAAIAFTHMPMTSPREVHARLRFGERQLESLAQTSEIARILDGVLSIGTGLAVVPVYLGPNNFRVENAFDYFVLVGAAVSVTTGAITLLTSTEAERRWSAYRELRERLLGTERGAADEAELERAAMESAALEGSIQAHASVAPLPGGALAGVTLAF